MRLTLKLHSALKSLKLIMDSFDMSFDSDLSVHDLLNDTIDSLHKLNVETDELLQQLGCAANTFIDKIIIIYLKHNLSLVCLEDLMELINTNREICDLLPTNKKQILKMFCDGRDMIEVLYFIRCIKCKKIVEHTEDMKDLQCCDIVLKKDETNFYVYLPIRKQIIQSIERNWECIKNFNTNDKDDDVISDAHDGAILKEVFKLYEQDEVNILSLCLNVDGANKYKSNFVSLWPIQFTQNYLPPNKRFLPHNVIVSGLMYTQDKFDFREYFLPVINELHDLKEKRIKMTIDRECYTFKPVITHCAVDLPAKSKIQEMKQFGGYDACGYCTIPGERIQIKCKTKSKKKNVNENDQSKMHSFVRYTEDGHVYPLREEEETLKKMLAASSDNETVDGIKDVSCLVAIEHFNILRSIGIDYMHCVLLGNQKKLLQLFCDPKYSNQPFYITKKKQAELNRRILALKPNREVVRKPRSLSDRGKFKASEFRSMLLYYLPVCLPGCIPDVYVKHLRLLSAATYILLKSKISFQEIDEAEKMLLKFVEDHQKLFGKEHMVMNIHLLKHLADSVRSLGPLWAHSAFPFERNNGVLLKKVNGTTDVLLQIASKYCLSKSIINARAKPKQSQKILLGRGEILIEKSLRVFNIETLKETDLSNKELHVHKRIMLKNGIYTSFLYTLPKKSIDYFIELQDGTIGKARFYFESNEKIYVVMEEFTVVDYIDHIMKIQANRRNILAPVQEIKHKYIYMKIGLHQYITLPPNPYENE